MNGCLGNACGVPPTLDMTMQQASTAAVFQHGFRSTRRRGYPTSRKADVLAAHSATSKFALGERFFPVRHREDKPPQNSPSRVWSFRVKAEARPPRDCSTPSYADRLEQQLARARAKMCKQVLTISELAGMFRTEKEYRIRSQKECFRLREQLERANARASAAEVRARAAEVAAAGVPYKDVVRPDTRLAAGTPRKGTPQDNGTPIDPPDFVGRFWQLQKGQCHTDFVAKVRAECALKVRVAEHALAPRRRMLGPLEKLGEGGFGGVYKTVCREANAVFAIKKPKTEADKQALIYEMLVYTWVAPHPNIIGVHSMDDRGPCPTLALECGDCDLFTEINSHRLSLPELLDLIGDVIEGVDHLHKHKVVLCDNKFENVIVKRNGFRRTASLADFGLVHGFGQTRQASCGTVGYYPSECFHQETAAEPSTDVFSVGVMLAIVVQQPSKRDSNVFASKLFQTKEDTRQLRQLRQLGGDAYKDYVKNLTYRTMTLDNDGFVKTATRPVNLQKMPGNVATTVRRLIRTMCSRVPANRPTMRSAAPALRSVAWGVRRMVHRHSATSAAAKPPAIESAAAYDSTNHNNNNNNNNNNHEDDVDMRAPVGTVRARRDDVVQPPSPSAGTPVDTGAVGGFGRVARMGCATLDGVAAVTLPPAPWTLSVAGMDAELSPAPARVKHAPKVCTSSGTPRLAAVNGGRDGADESRSPQGMLYNEQGRQDDAGYEGAGVGWGGARKGARVGTRHEGWGREVDNEGRGMVAVSPFPPELNHA